MEEKVVQSLPEREFQSANSSIISQVFRGILVGLFVGGIVGLFRLMIEKSFHWIQSLYEKSHENFTFLGIILILYLFIMFLVAWLMKSEKNIKGSGIPQVEAELKGLMSLAIFQNFFGSQLW